MQPNVVTVSELNLQARDILERNFGTIYVIGELSNLSRPGSGHIYFSLKDINCQVRCAMFKGASKNIDFNLKDGMEVQVEAKVSLYPNRGDYQLIVSKMTASGEGLLKQEYDRLVKELATKGLFQEKYKKKIPYLPKQIGVITSSTGAAIKDVLSVLKRRCPAIPIIIYPTSVQGSNAKNEIVKAITLANIDNSCDVLIICRGGGSLEDLWPFNEEIVAKSIFESQIPIVSGVGHEVDFTICDLVADKRAATPSAAAELVSPDINELIYRVNDNKVNLISFMQRVLETHYLKVDNLQKRLQHPGERIRYQQDKLSTLIKRIIQSAKINLNGEKDKLKYYISSLYFNKPNTKFLNLSKQLIYLKDKLITSQNNKIVNTSYRLKNICVNLDSLSPLATLSRGYSIAKNKTGKIINKVTDVKNGDNLEITLQEGKIECLVTNTKNC